MRDSVSHKNRLDWIWQMQNRITNMKDADKILSLTPDEKAGFAAPGVKIPFALTPYYASVIKDVPALRKCCLPGAAETVKAKYETNDPLGEESCHPAPNLFHKYKNRVLLLVGTCCPCYCRYCTRGRLAGSLNFTPVWDREIDYITQHTEICDVLISGGEPLLLSDEQLDDLLSRLRAIKHVDLIRIGTKVPVTMPMRLTKNLIKILKKHGPVTLSIHINRPEELTDLVAEKMNLLADSGIIMGSQSVLLKSVNDDAEILYRLFYKLLKNRCRPYYLFQCDPIYGSAHFRVPVAKGLQIMDDLRKTASGYAIPTYAIDIPNRFGKIALLPSRIKGNKDGMLEIENFDGTIYHYPE